MFFGLEYELDTGTKIGDVNVLGKPLREWTVEDIEKDVGTDSTAYGDWLDAVFKLIPVGDDLNEIISEEFNTAFYAKRNEISKIEINAAQINTFKAKAATYLGKELAEVEVVTMFEIPIAGWEMDHLYAAVRVDGKILYVGTDHGGTRIYTRENIIDQRDEKVKELAAINAALEIE